MRHAPAVTLASALALATLAGCEAESKSKQQKIEYDRMTLKLAQTEQARDDLKGQVEKLTAETTATAGRVSELQSQLDNAQASLKAAQEDLTKARASLAGADQTAAQLKTTQSKLQDAQKQTDAAKAQADGLNARVGELQVRVKTLESDLTKALAAAAASDKALKEARDTAAKSAPATSPMMP
jgi:chromosome segregation ATPase